MLGLVQNWFAPRCNPIGVDFGSETLRMAQVHWTGGDYELIAAASADVPAHLRTDADARMSFFVETTRDLLAQGQFRGRNVVLALPAAHMCIQHLRMPKLDEEALKKALPWEARGKLPIDPAHALMRHVVAGEIYQDQEPKAEVIVMAAAREMVNQLLSAAARAKLNVVGMNVEPMALLDCFTHVYRRKIDAEATNCFVDIGAAATRAVITRGGQILFARVIPVGGDQLCEVVAKSLRMGVGDAKLLRIKLAAIAPALDEHRERQTVDAPPAAAAAHAAAEPEPAPETLESAFPLLGAALSATRKEHAAEPAPAVAPAHAPEHPAEHAGAGEHAGSGADAVAVDPALLAQAHLVEQACAEPVNRLVDELDLCRRYYESTFPSHPVDRLIFVGGEARQKALCQAIARHMGLAAQLGDPLVRMGRTSTVGIESGIDRRQPQPNWAVAIGLSMGPQQPATTGGGRAAKGAAAAAAAKA